MMMMMMNNRRFYNFPRITVAVYFTEFESIIVYRGTRRARYLPEKAHLYMKCGMHVHK